MRALLVAMVASAALTAPAFAQTDACIDAYASNWGKAVDAMDAKKPDAALKNVEAVITACGNDTPSHDPRVLKAQILIERGDPAGAIAALAPVPQPGPPPRGARAAWLAMQAYALAGEGAKLIQVRNRLVEAVDLDITAPGGQARGKKIETWEIPEAQIVSYSLNLQQGDLLRLYYFLVIPKAPGLPESVMITNDLSKSGSELVPRPGERKPVTLSADQYDCGGHSTLETIDAAGAGRYATLAYDRAKASLDKYLASKSGAPVIRQPLKVCAGIGSITPLP
jgi:hypothetical protein